MTLRKKIRFILLTIFVIFFFFLVWQKLVPFGVITYTHNFSQDDRFISQLSPDTRIKDSNKIISDPVYLSLFTPRRFEEAEVTLTYNNQSKSDFKAGFLVDEKLWRYDLKPIENKNLEKLTNDWFVIKNNNLLFLQKEKKFSSLKEFLNQEIPRDKTVLYNYNLDNSFKLSNYNKNSEIKEKNLFLRGPHELFIYLGENEDLFLDLNFLDLNQNKDKDDILISLYYKNKAIFQEEIKDDREKENSGILIENIKKKINLTDLIEGVYKLEIKTTDDIVLENVLTPHSKISVNNKLWLYKKGRSDLNIYSKADNLRLKTVNPSSLQTLTVNNEQKINLNKTYTQHNVNLEVSNNPKEINLETDGLILETDGCFSFSQEEFFNPKFKSFSLDINLENINYVLANYTPANKLENNLKQKTVEFSLSSAYREEGKYSFLFSLPDIKEGEYLELKNIEIKFKGKSLWQVIKDKF